MKREKWLVSTADEGVLRAEPSRRAAVRWAKMLLDCSRVRQRIGYVTGSYEYLLSGDDDDEVQSVFIFRAENVDLVGVPSAEQKPLYPHEDRPFDWVDRMDG